jgi:hypothetical protein
MQELSHSYQMAHHNKIRLLRKTGMNSLCSWHRDEMPLREA